jgi:sporulation protein YlmC with PRC-barrel domain
MHSKLSESELRLEESWQDILGLDVYDITDEQMGSVEDLCIDREACQPRFLVVQEKQGNGGGAESMWGRFGRRRRKRRTGRGEALRQTLSALGSVRRHTRDVAGSAPARHAPGVSCRGRRLCASCSSGRRFRSGSHGPSSSSLHYGSRSTACSVTRRRHSNLVNI